MTVDFDPDPAAAMLADLYRTGRQIAELPAEIRPRTLGEGYDVQDRLMAALGADVVGWKLGLGSRRAKRESGIGRSVAGRLLARQVAAPGATVSVPDAAPVTVEFEVAFVLSRTIRPGEPIEDPSSVVAEARAAFELVRSRFVDRRAAGWPSFAADNAAFHALVLGPALDPARLGEIVPSLVVEADGVERARAATGEEETVPLDALADLMAIAAERDMLLPAGALVSTGTMSVPFNVSGPTRIAARYSGGELAFALDLDARARGTE